MLVESSSSDYREQTVFLHYSKDCFRIFVYALTFKPDMNSTIAIGLSARLLTCLYLLGKREILRWYIHSFDIVIVTASRYVEEPAHFTYSVFIFVTIDHMIFYAWSHFLSVSERKSRINSFSISKDLILLSLRAIMYFSSWIFVSSVTT